MTINSTAYNLVSKLFSNTLVAGLSLAESATYRKVVASAFDLSAGTYTETETDTSIYLIKTTFTNGEIAQSNGNILTTDVRFYIRPQSGVTLNAMMDDQIIYGGKTYTIKDVEKRSLGATDIVFVIQAGVVE